MTYPVKRVKQAQGFCGILRQKRKHSSVYGTSKEPTMYGISHAAWLVLDRNKDQCGKVVTMTD